MLCQQHSIVRTRRRHLYEVPTHCTGLYYSKQRQKQLTTPPLQSAVMTALSFLVVLLFVLWKQEHSKNTPEFVDAATARMADSIVRLGTERTVTQRILLSYTSVLGSVGDMKARGPALLMCLLYTICRRVVRTGETARSSTDFLVGCIVKIIFLTFSSQTKHMLLGKSTTVVLHVLSPRVVSAHAYPIIPLCFCVCHLLISLQLCWSW